MKTFPAVNRPLRQVFLLLLCALLLFSCVRADAQVLACHPDKTDLYAEPGGDVIARLFYNTPVTLLDDAGPAGWSRVTVGDDTACLTGWIADADLDESDPGSGPSLTTGSEAFPCSHIRELPLRTAPDSGASVRETWNSGSGTNLTVTAVTADNMWLLAAVQENGRPVLWGFVPAESVRTFMSGLTLADRKKAGATVNLRAAPSRKAAVLGAYYSGAPVDLLFSYEEPPVGWRRVSIGGAAGYMMDQYIETDAADGVGFRSPLLPLSGKSAPLFASSAGPRNVDEPSLLTPADIFCVLGKAGTRWHVRVLTGSPDVSVYGYVDTGSLAGKKPSCGSLHATLARKSPLFSSCNGEEEEAECKKGTKVWIEAFCAPAPDGEEPVTLEYYRDGAGWVRVIAFLPTSYGYDEPVSGYLPVDALKFDSLLRIPSGMGVQ